MGKLIIPNSIDNNIIDDINNVISQLENKVNSNTSNITTLTSKTNSLTSSVSSINTKWQQTGVQGVTLDYNPDGTDVYIRWKISSSTIYLVSFGIAQRRIALYRFVNNSPTLIWSFP